VGDPSGGKTPVAVKQQVRAFYDSIGWSLEDEGLYQNARYEDLRPVSREYIQRCHLRPKRFLPQAGRYLLDAGSGPIQYPAYLGYSEGHTYRVCLDLSRRALVEARRRLADRGLYVVGDAARLPFAAECMDGVVSLHMVHHLPPEEHEVAFREMVRVLKPGMSGVVVYNWGRSSLISRGTRWIADRAFRTRRWGARVIRGRGDPPAADRAPGFPAAELPHQATGTFTHTHDYRWALQALGDLPGLEIRVWRTVGVQFLRAVIHPRLGGRWLLRLLYWLEERAPYFFGRHGMYPLIVLRKPLSDSE
jgi:SAM-dependent methyltransferase